MRVWIKQVSGAVDCMLHLLVIVDGGAPRCDRYGTGAAGHGERWACRLPYYDTIDVTGARETTVKLS